MWCKFHCVGHVRSYLANSSRDRGFLKPWSGVDTFTLPNGRLCAGKRVLLWWWWGQVQEHRRTFSARDLIMQWSPSCMTTPSAQAKVVTQEGWPLTGGAGTMGFAVRVRSVGQKYGPTCHQRDRADVTEFVTLVQLLLLGQHVGVLVLAGYKCQKSALTAGPIILKCEKQHQTLAVS